MTDFNPPLSQLPIPSTKRIALRVSMHAEHALRQNYFARMQLVQVVDCAML